MLPLPGLFYNNFRFISQTLAGLDVIVVLCCQNMSYSAIPFCFEYCVLLSTGLSALLK